MLRSIAEFCILITAQQVTAQRDLVVGNTTKQEGSHLIQGQLLHHAIPPAALAKQCKNFMLAAVVQHCLDPPGTAHVQAVAPYL